MTDHYTTAENHLATYKATRSVISPLPPHEHLTLAAVEANLAIAEAINRHRLNTFLAPIPLFDGDLNQTASAGYNDGDDTEALREV